MVTNRVAPGIVYTTCHHPDTQAHMVTMDDSDWTPNGPGFKVTTMQVMPSNDPGEWQKSCEEHARVARRIIHAEAAE